MNEKKLIDSRNETRNNNEVRISCRCQMMLRRANIRYFWTNTVLPLTGPCFSVNELFFIC